MKKNLMHVQYDPEKVTPEKLLEAVGKVDPVPGQKEFQATIVPDQH